VERETGNAGCPILFRANKRANFADQLSTQFHRSSSHSPSISASVSESTAATESGKKKEGSGYHSSRRYP
jgi:hypothetical protein